MRRPRGVLLEVCARSARTRRGGCADLPLSLPEGERGSLRNPTGRGGVGRVKSGSLSGVCAGLRSSRRRVCAVDALRRLSTFHQLWAWGL